MTEWIVWEPLMGQKDLVGWRETPTAQEKICDFRPGMAFTFSDDDIVYYVRSLNEIINTHEVVNTIRITPSASIFDLGDMTEMEFRFRYE
jgi:hypothetical protein